MAPFQSPVWLEHSVLGMSLRVGRGSSRWIICEGRWARAVSCIEFQNVKSSHWLVQGGGVGEESVGGWRHPSISTAWKACPWIPSLTCVGLRRLLSNMSINVWRPQLQIQTGNVPKEHYLFSHTAHIYRVPLLHWYCGGYGQHHWAVPSGSHRKVFVRDLILICLCLKTHNYFSTRRAVSLFRTGPHTESFSGW